MTLQAAAAIFTFPDFLNNVSCGQIEKRRVKIGKFFLTGSNQKVLFPPPVFTFAGI
jgi:hypothetical protein